MVLLSEVSPVLKQFLIEIFTISTIAFSKVSCLYLIKNRGDIK